MIIWITAALPWLRDRAEEFGDFLRSIPSLLAPKPTSLASPYTPPFTGGQCDVQYRVFINFTVFGGAPAQANVVGTGRVQGLQIKFASPEFGVGVVFIAGDGTRDYRSAVSNPNGTFEIAYVVRVDGQPDNCGNLSNPIPPPSVSDDGLFNPTNPHIADDNGTVNPAAIVLAPAFPLVLVGAILGGYSAAMGAASAAGDALASIKKVAEGLDALKTLWEKLKEFLDEWEKNRPSKRDIVRQTYGRILGDGALDFFPDNNTKFKAIQLDVVITNIPIGYGRYFGSLSPSRYRYRELGYIAFYSINQGILETHSIQFKRTSYQIPELAVGFIYHLGLDEQIKGFAFGTFSVEKT